MAGVIQCFCDEFLPVHRNDEHVDLSSLVEKLKNFTPIPLRCLPELTNADERNCPYSRNVQAWSSATLIQAFYDLTRS